MLRPSSHTVANPMLDLPRDQVPVEPFQSLAFLFLYVRQAGFLHSTLWTVAEVVVILLGNILGAALLEVRNLPSLLRFLVMVEASHCKWIESKVRIDIFHLELQLVSRTLPSGLCFLKILI